MSVSTILRSRKKILNIVDNIYRLEASFLPLDNIDNYRRPKWPSQFDSTSVQKLKFSRRKLLSFNPSHCRDFYSQNSQINVQVQALYKYSSSSPYSKRKSTTNKDSGWSYNEVTKIPNVISLTRLSLGPVVAMSILNEYSYLSMGCLSYAAFSDWLDGFAARVLKQQSVFGSYLDPLADKVRAFISHAAKEDLVITSHQVFIGCVAASLYLKGSFPEWLFVATLGRDIFLLSGAFFQRASSLGWKWRDSSHFFQISEGGATMLEPLQISKLNTVLQMLLFGVILTNDLFPSFELFSEDSVKYLSYSVGCTTAASGIAYVFVFLKK